jgi:Tol biopolymer transport system component
MNVRIAVGVALVLVVAFSVWFQRGIITTATTTEDALVRPAAMSSLVQLTTHSGLDLEPAFSPREDAIAFVSDRSGTLEIYVRAVGGRAIDVPLTSDGGENVQPAWSPDGQLVVYHSNRRGGIWVIPARGGTPRQIAPKGSNPAWSSDGARIAFQSDEHPDISPDGFGAQNGSTIWAVNPDGSGLQPLTRNGSPNGGHAAPAWSRDGRFLSFSVFEAASDNGIWLLTLATGETRHLARDGGLVDSLFSPEGDALYVAGAEPVLSRIPLDVRTGNANGPREIIPVPGVPSVRGLTISADGHRLGFAGIGLSSQIWAQSIDREGAPRGTPRALTSDTSRRNIFPAVSPDGSKVAYTARHGGEAPNIWVMDVDGGHSAHLTADSSGDHNPEWFPDGRRIAFLSNRGETRGIWAVEIATRREALLADTTRPDLPPGVPRPNGRLMELDLSPTMTRAAFALLTPPLGRRVTYVTGIDRFVPRALNDSTLSVGYPIWSPDERRIAVQIKGDDGTQAGAIDVESGTLRRLTNEPGETWARSWSPDGRRIAVAALRGGAWNLKWIDADSGRHGDITQPEPPRVYVRYPDWSRRGDVVVYERGEMRGNIWTMVVR